VARDRRSGRPLVEPDYRIVRGGTERPREGAGLLAASLPAQRRGAKAAGA